MGACQSSTGRAPSEPGSPAACGGARPASAGRDIKPDGQVALCFQGGGFLSQATFSGVIAGLLRREATERGLEATLEATGLLRRFGLVSSVSGGSWFVSELAYSPEFQALVEAMAADPASAGRLWETEWNKKWFACLTKDSANAKLFEALAHVLPEGSGKGLMETLAMVGHFQHGDLTWLNFVETLLQSTAGIRPDATMGSKVRPWADGKVWLLNNSLLAPSSEHRGADQVFAIGNLTNWGYHYSAEGLGGDRPVFLPTRFSTTWSSSGQAPSCAPVPFIAEGALPADAKLLWKCGRDGGMVHHAASDFDFSNLQRPEQLPLAQAVATSSAFLGSLVLSRSYTWLVSNLFHGQLSVWADTAAEGQAISSATKLLDGIKHANQAGVAEVAAAGVFCLGDGGFTDGTGIASAVAAGAREVFFCGQDISSVEALCSAGNGARYTESALDGLPMNSFPIFGESQEEFRAHSQKFRGLSDFPSTGPLSSLSFGTLALTTADSPYFGITGGHKITLHCMVVTSQLTIGYNEVFSKYSEYVQELVQAISDAILANPEVPTDVLPALRGE